MSDNTNVGLEFGWFVSTTRAPPNEWKKLVAVVRAAGAAQTNVAQLVNLK